MRKIVIAFMVALIISMSCQMSLATPTGTNSYPADGATAVELQPTCEITTAESEGHTVNVTWYEKTTGSWVCRQANMTVANGTYTWVFTQASEDYTKYDWKVHIDNGTTNISVVRWFRTKSGWADSTGLSGELKADIVDIVIWGFVLAMIIAVMAFVIRSVKGR